MERSQIHPDDYLASLGAEIAATMKAADLLIREAMPGASRSLWTGVFWGGTEQTIIGYGDLRQPRPKGPDVDWFQVGLARQKRDYSVYVNAVEDGAYLVQSYADRLGRAKVGSANISFTSLAGVDHAVLTELLRRAHDLG